MLFLSDALLTIQVFDTNSGAYLCFVSAVVPLLPHLLLGVTDMGHHVIQVLQHYQGGLVLDSLTEQA